MPPCFHIAHLKRYVPNFSGVPQKLTWRNRFGLQLPPKWHDRNNVRPKQAIFRPFLVENQFSRPNGPLSPYTCYTYSESWLSWILHPPGRLYGVVFKDILNVLMTENLNFHQALPGSIVFKSFFRSALYSSCVAVEHKDDFKRICWCFHEFINMKIWRWKFV